MSNTRVLRFAYSTVLICASAFVLATSPAAADSVTSAYAGVGSICGGSAIGTSFASVSFNCVFTDIKYGGYPYFYGSALAETGVGPYGIGGIVTVNINGNFGVSEYWGLISSSGQARLDWSQDFIIEGAQGNGFVQPEVLGGGTCGYYTVSSLSIWGESVPEWCTSIYQPGWLSPIPVTFGVPYTLSMHGFAGAEALDAILGGTIDFYVADLRFTDASGNPLSGLTVEAVPEPSSLVLTCTGLLIISTLLLWKRRMASNARGTLRIYRFLRGYAITGNVFSLFPLRLPWQAKF